MGKPAGMTKEERALALKYAKLISMDYYDSEAEAWPRVVLNSRNLHVRAVKTNGSVIYIVRGSDDLMDWINNFTYGKKRLIDKSDMEAGASGAKYYYGFIRDARRVYNFFTTIISNPALLSSCVLIGHSRGAAIAAIVGSSLPIRTMCFACPRVVVRKDGARLPFEDGVVVINRSDDLICSVPPRKLGFEHLGHVHVLTPKKRRIGEDHRILHYISLLEDEDD